MSIQVIPYDSEWRDRWDAYVNAHVNSSFSHRRAWADVLVTSVGHRCRSFLACRNDTVTGILPLFQVKSILFGNFLVSAPAANACGILSDGEEVTLKLLQHAEELRASLGCTYVELRQEGAALQELPCKDTYLTTIVPLSSDPQSVKSKISKKIKRDLNRATRDGLSVEYGAEFLDDFYHQYGEHMRRLGSPQFSKTFFSSIVESFGESSELVVVRQNGRTVAGNIAIRHRGRINNLYAGAEPAAMKSGAVSLFCWEQIERGCLRGMTEYDLGRSTAGSSSHEYKKFWNGEDVPYHYGYLMKPGHPMPDKETDSLKFQIASRVWKKLPRFLAEELGPRLVRNLH